MFLFSMEGDAQRAARLANLVERVLHRLGDSDQKIWSYEEILDYIQIGGAELTTQVRCVWDQTFLECVPAGFSYTAEWEAAYVDFDYGLASYTFPDEAEFLDDLGMEKDDVQQANHTSPSELHFLEDLPASTDQRALHDLPETLLDIDRAAFDHSTVVATTHHRIHRNDTRYQITAGDVVAFTVEDEGYRKLRMIRVPNALATLYTYDGSWGVARDVEDVTRDTISGTWGLPRIVAGHHPMGDTEGWGFPRRFHHEDDNFKLEYWRTPRVEAEDSELPARYHLYLGDFAQWKALHRVGPGQDFKLGQLYKDRWERGLARVKSRAGRQHKEKMYRMGGESDTYLAGPPRPRLPWQYGQRLR